MRRRTYSHLQSFDFSMTERIFPRRNPCVEFRFVDVDFVGSIVENAEEKARSARSNVQESTYAYEAENILEKINAR